MWYARAQYIWILWLVFFFFFFRKGFWRRVLFFNTRVYIHGSIYIYIWQIDREIRSVTWTEKTSSHFIGGGNPVTARNEIWGDLHLISRGRFGWRSPCHCLTFECVAIYRDARIPAASIPPDVYIWDYWVVALLRTSYPPTYACSFTLVTESVSIVLMRPHFPRYVCAPHPESDDGISERKWRCAHIECSWVVYCSLLAIASAAAPLGTIKFHQAERRIFFVKVRERERKRL